jgi:aerobic C4-dicarboxylate transport protein
MRVVSEGICSCAEGSVNFKTDWKARNVSADSRAMKPWKSLYGQVLIAIVLGVAFGYFAPEKAAAFKPLGDAFIKAIKLLIAPIIFTTVVTGIAGMGNVEKVGRVGWKAFLYFEVVSTLALAIGLVVAHVIQPGANINADPATLDASSVSGYTTAAKKTGATAFLLHIIPDTFMGAFVEGEILQVLFISILTGLALAKLGDQGRPILEWLHGFGVVMFGIVGLVVKAAPLAAFGAMAFTIGKYGLGTLWSLGKLMGAVYLTCAVFIFGVLGVIARLHGFSLWKTLRFIREELLIVLGTSSSESVLPAMMQKMHAAGCSRSVVGIVLPAGYSFNLDGTSIYLSMAALFIAQATNTQLTVGHELEILAILLLTSKGSAGVTGSGFITLAATLSATGTIPVAGLALIIGVDRFMSEARAITNLIGNTVAMLVVAKWEGEFDAGKGKHLLSD